MTHSSGLNKSRLGCSGMSFLNFLMSRGVTSLRGPWVVLKIDLGGCFLYYPLILVGLVIWLFLELFFDSLGFICM